MRDGGLVERHEKDERRGNLLRSNHIAFGLRWEDMFGYEVTLWCQQPFC